MRLQASWALALFETEGKFFSNMDQQRLANKFFSAKKAALVIYWKNSQENRIRHAGVRWHCNKSLSNKLQKLQNRAPRILTFSSHKTSADPLFEQLNWKRLDTQQQIQVAAMVYKSIHGLVPDYLSSLFTKYDPPYNNLKKLWKQTSCPIARHQFPEK